MRLADLNKTDTKKVLCYHCGDECRDDHVVFEGKDFCCNGCKTVYEIFEKNGLCDYYDLEKNPGIKIKAGNFGEKYDFLDNTEIQNNLLSFKDEHISKISLYIPSIHCSSCIWLLENLSRLEKGILYSRVNFTEKEIVIDFDTREISLKQVVILLTSVRHKQHL